MGVEEVIRFSKLFILMEVLRIKPRTSCMLSNAIPLSYTLPTYFTFELALKRYYT